MLVKQLITQYNPFIKKATSIRTQISTLLLLLVTNGFAASPVWTFNPLTATTLSVAASDTVSVVYVIQNQSQKSKKLAMQAIKGISQIGECQLAAKGTTGSSCTLTLTINGSELTAQGVHGGPILCQTNADGSPNSNQCYRPSAEHELHISKNATPPPSQATLSLSPAVLSYLVGNNSTMITLTNKSATIPATGIMITPPSTVTIENSTCGSTLAPLAQCSFALSTTAAGPANIIITGDNSNTQTAVATALTPGLLYAAGMYQAPGDPLKPVIYSSKNGGASWSDTYLQPVNDDNHLLNGIACHSNGSHCFAVGYYGTVNEALSLAYYSNDTGDTWDSIYNLPDMPIPNLLNAVSCSPSGSICAIGGTATGMPFIFYSTDGGNSWHQAELNAQESASSTITALSCTDDRCVAVGEYLDINGMSQASAYESIDGAVWNTLTVPDANSALYAVSCTTNQCAAGGYQSTTPRAYTLAANSSELHPSVTQPATQGTSNNTLTSISCADSGRCLALARIGSETELPISSSTYLSQDGGINWLFTSLIPPAQETTVNMLRAISCNSSGNQCLMAGSYFNGTEDQLVLYFSYNGGTDWAISNPATGLPNSYLTSAVSTGGS
ncbi:MAG: WD40/YVTN/BNR-like repeat-containing protein [Legionella sp.]